MWTFRWSSEDILHKCKIIQMTEYNIPPKVFKVIVYTGESNIRHVGYLSLLQPAADCYEFCHLVCPM